MKHRWNWLGLLVLLGLLGCGGPEGLPVVPVHGQVTLDGQPLEGALVTFVPQTTQGTAASGTTDAEGNYLLQTPGASQPGALPGGYQITISKLEIKTVRTPEEALAEAKEKGMMLPPPTRDATHLLPAKYRNPARSGFQATVSETGENEFVFAVKST